MNNQKLHTRLSKFLSLVLRHQPEVIGITLDDQGWTNVDDLIEKMNDFGKPIDRSTLDFVVANNNKRRFVIDTKQNRIRANQGHSIEIELGYPAKEPPTLLYHGTARKKVDFIFKTGLEKRSRHHVHLSPDVDTAIKVGQRHGKPVVLEVKAKEMHLDGYTFFISENGVWLTDSVPVKYLKERD